MSAGTFPAGAGPAGLDPPATPSAQASQAAPPRALKFDPTIHGFVQNADGSMADVHPVDQQVAIALFFEAGPSGPSLVPSAFQASVPSAPRTGNRLRARLNRLDPARAQATAEDEVRVRLAPLIANADILLVRVTASTTPLGAAGVAVEYVNLRATPPDPTNPTLSTTVVQGAIA